MQIYTDNISSAGLSMSEPVSRMQDLAGSDYPADRRPETVAQRKVQELADQSPQVVQLARIQELANQHAVPSVQRKAVGSGGSDDVIQRVINDIPQPTTNSCWAAVGYAVHLHNGGLEPTIDYFVNNMGNAASRSNYAYNRMNDIDGVIGSGSGNDMLTGSDSSGTYGKTGISAKLNKGKAIIANVDNNHYIVLKSSTSGSKGAYQVTYMDPATGTTKQEMAVSDPLESSKITHIGAYKLTVLYYT